MSAYGVLVKDWPLVLGVDTGGIVVEVGESVTPKYGLKVGDEVFGCTRLGCAGYSCGQEYFLMDACVTIPKPANLPLVDAATLGVASETASLALFEGLELPLPDPNSLPEPQDEWVIILGGASSVGKCAIQLAKACGYNVAASCSRKSADVVKAFGAVPFDYKRPLEQQLEDVLEIAKDKIAGIFDAVAEDDPVLAKALFKASQSGRKLFATTNDWSAIGDFENGKTYPLELGGIGRPEAQELNKNIERYIPVIVGLVAAGRLLPGEHEVIGDGGFEDAVRAYQYQRSGAGGSRKVVVKVQDP